MHAKREFSDRNFALLEENFLNKKNDRTEPEL